MKGEHLYPLTILAEISDAGSITQAAARLGLVKSSVSHQIAALEKALGVKVLNRSGRSVALTTIGETLAAHGRAIRAEAQQARAAAKESEQPRGTLRVSMPAGIGDQILIPMLADFLRAFPGISIDAIATDKMLDLAAERIDVAFRIGGVADGPFIARKLYEDRNIFVASPRYLAQSAAIMIPADLSQHPLIGFAPFGRRQSFQIESEDGSRSEVEMTCRVTTTSGLAIKHWTLAGAGIARLPVYVAREELADGRLVRVLPQHDTHHPVISVVYLPERFRPANARRLIDFALAWFKPDPAA